MYSIGKVVTTAFIVGVPLVTARLFRRDIAAFGPGIYAGPASQDIVQFVTTTYPGAIPPSQQGGLFLWPGLANGTGDLIQSIVGSYPPGQSECSGANADTEWYVSTLISLFSTEGPSTNA